MVSLSSSEYWAAVHQTIAELPDVEVHYITHKGSKQVVEVSRRNAAVMLVQGKHRLATPEEIEAMHAERQQRKHEIEAAELERKSGGTMDSMARAFQLAIQSGAAFQQQATASNPAVNPVAQGNPAVNPATAKQAKQHIQESR